MDTLERFSKFYNKNRHWILGGGLLVLAIIVTIAVFILLPERKTVDEKLYLSEKYIREGEYQLAFYEAEDVLDFDSECVEAYKFMALAYEGLGNMADAIDILREGVVKTDSAMLKRLLYEREGNFMVSEDELEDESSSGEVTSDTESTAETTTEAPTTTAKPTTTKKPTTTAKPTTTEATTTAAPTTESTTASEETPGEDENTESTGEGDSGSEETTTAPEGGEIPSTDESTEAASETSTEADSSTDGTSTETDTSSESETTSVAQ